MENKSLKERNSSLKISQKEMEEKVVNLKDELAATSDLQYSSVSIKKFSLFAPYVSFLQNKLKIKTLNPWKLYWERISIKNVLLSLLNFEIFNSSLVIL